MTRVTETRRNDANVRQEFLRPARLPSTARQIHLPILCCVSMSKAHSKLQPLQIRTECSYQLLKRAAAQTTETAGLKMLSISTRMRGLVVTLVWDDSETMRSFCRCSSSSIVQKEEQHVIYGRHLTATKSRYFCVLQAILLIEISTHVGTLLAF